MKNQKRNKIIGIIAVCIIVISLVGLVNKSQDIEAGLISINEAEIPLEEYKMFLQDQKALTVNYFVQTYGIEYGAEFWNSTYGEENPLELAKERALEALTQTKIEQQIAQELGLIKDNQFETIREQIKDEKSIYGADNLDIFQQYTVYHSKLMLEAMQKYKIAQKDLNEAVLREKYEKIKETTFKPLDYIESINLEIKGLELKQANEYLTRIIGDIHKGIQVNELIEKYREHCEIIPELKAYGDTEGKDENMSEIEQLLKEEAYRLEKGEMSGPITYGEDYYLVICMEKKVQAAAAFEEVKIVVEDMLKEEQFKVYIQSEVEQAKIKIDEERYRTILME